MKTKDARKKEEARQQRQQSASVHDNMVTKSDGDLDMSSIAPKWERGTFVAVEEQDPLKMMANQLLAVPYGLELFSVLAVAGFFFVFSFVSIFVAKMSCRCSRPRTTLARADANLSNTLYAAATHCIPVRCTHITHALARCWYLCM
ncbi:MAG: hypothetical protein P4L10_14170, partial [Acidobacteriaceae bacterium]|nr:hypothetical protein [Acidobacteriaceae bacterium]